MLISKCCGASTPLPELDICPECYEHCEFEDTEEAT